SRSSAATSRGVHGAWAARWRVTRRAPRARRPAIDSSRSRMGCTKDLGQGLSSERIWSMAEQRRRFSPQFKAEAVQMVIETGKPIAEVARDLGIHDGTLGNWVNAWRREYPEPDRPVSPMER